MIQRLRQRLFRLQTVYDDPLNQQRAQLMLYIFVAAAVLCAFLSAIFIFNAVTGVTDGLTPQRILTVIAFFLTIGLYFAIQRGYIRFAGVVIVGFSLAAALQPLLFDLTTHSTYTLAIPLIAAGLFLRWQGVLIASLVALVGISIALAIQAPIIAEGENQVFRAYLGIFTITLTLTAMLLGFAFSLQRIAGDLLQDLQRYRGLVSHFSLDSLNTSSLEIITETINLIYDQLDYDIVRIYLVEGNQSFSRRYGSSLNRGQVLVDENVNIAPDSGLMQALRTRTIQVLEFGSARSHFASGMTVGMAVPVLDGNDVLAVLDLQREASRSIGLDEQQAVAFIGLQFGQALAETRLLADLRNNLSDQTRIIEQQRQRLRSLERAEHESVVDTWSSYVGQRGVPAIGFDLPDIASDPVLSTLTPEDLKEAIQADGVTVERQGAIQHVRVPIQLRGQTIGAMSFNVPLEKQILGNNQQELIENVVQRLGLALENKRLFERSQAQARREREANRVGSVLLGTTDIETVLRLAADSFNEALGAVQTEISLNSESQHTIEDRS